MTREAERASLLAQLEVLRGLYEAEVDPSAGAFVAAQIAWIECRLGELGAE